MKKIIIVFVAFITMLAFVSGAVAQVKKAEQPAPAVQKANPVSPAPAAEKAKAEKPKAVKIQKASGTVAAYDAAAKTLKVTVKKNEMDFSVADDAKIKGEIKAGEKVTVSYKKEGDKMIASAITVAASPKVAKKEEKAK